MRKMRITRDDIAAMEIVADRQASFTHHLNLRHIDIHWVLDATRKKPKSFLRRKRSQSPGSLVVASRVSPVKDLRGEDSPIHRPGSDPGGIVALSEGHSDHEHSFEESPSASDGGDEKSNTAASPLRFRPIPPILDTLETLDRTMDLEGKPACLTLINSPRSAYIILKSGCNVPDLCGVPKQQYFNQGLLDGITVETVKMRIDAEEERRAVRFPRLLKEYREIASQVSVEDFVNSIRNHKYGTVLQHAADESHLKKVPLYSHPGKLDISVLDTDCVDVLVEARGKTLGEIRRVLDQKDRHLRQSIERERALFEKERKLEEDSKHARMQYEREREEKSRALAEKRETVFSRVRHLLGSRDGQDEMKRQELLQLRSVQNDVRKEKQLLVRSETICVAKNKDLRRLQIKKQEEQRREQRRQEFLQKAAINAMIAEGALEQKKRKLAQRRADFDALAQARREKIRGMAQREIEERISKYEETLSVAATRTKEIEYVRDLRREQKRKTLEERFARGVATRQNAESIKQQRFEELEKESKEKRERLEEMLVERKRRQDISREIRAQESIEKFEERERVTGTAEFKLIGFMNSNTAKSEWISQENVKRGALTLQVQHEREAMLRAKDEILMELDQQEIQRRKKETPVPPSVI